MSLTVLLYLSLFVPGNPGLRGPRGGAAARPPAIPGVRRYASARPPAEADAALDGPEGGRVVGRYAPQP